MNRLLTILICVLVMLPGIAGGQTVLMPTMGHCDTTMSYAEVYDDGGPYLYHSPICNASYTFHTVNTNGHYRIEVESALTHPVGNASLSIYNGGSESGSAICAFPSGSGGVYYSSGNTVTIRFVSDDDIPTQGFKVTLCEYNNAVASNLSMSYTDSNTMHIQWNGGTNSTEWIVNWAVICESVVLDTFFANPANYNADTLNVRELDVYNIPVGCWVVYNIYSEPVTGCSPPVMGNSGVYQPPFVCPCYGPSIVNIVELEDSLRISWTSDSVPGSWHLWTGYGGIDTVVPGTVNEITIPYDYPCTGNVINIINDCNIYCNVKSVSLPSGGCMLMVSDLTSSDITPTSFTVSWNDADDPAARYLLKMYPVGSYDENSRLVDTLDYGTTSYSFSGLNQMTDYMVDIWVICPDGSLSCRYLYCVVRTLMDNCIDYANNTNNNEHVQYTFGNYSNPTAYSGRQIGRHTVMTGQGQTDPNTGNALLCVPPDEIASFKLGDQNIGGNGETVTYKYFVDSLDKDMLVLKYAVVMQNPNHTADNQPRFTLEILDDNGNLIDSTCCYADFVAGGNLGWNTVSGSNVIWKDWTTVGIDIARYHGQYIKIRFTTKDCADGGHFGYAYFVVHCDNKRIALVNLCESDDSVRLRAPLGFEYLWVRAADSAVISTENEIIVPADSSLYRCYATFIGRPECSFVISSRAILPYPKADFDFVTDTCGQRVYLIDRSYVDIDSVYLPYVRQYIDSAIWVVDGNVYYGDTVAFDARGDTLFDVALYSHLSQSACFDSLVRTINVNVAHSQRLAGDTTACLGDTVRLAVRLTPPEVSSFIWYDSISDTVRHYVCNSDTSVYILANYKNCHDTVWHHISVYGTNDDTITVQSCVGVHDSLGFFADSSGTYTLHLQNRFGCDSLSTLVLTVYPSYYDTVDAQLCDESFVNDEFNEDSTGFYVHPYVTGHGCDSIYCLSFKRFPVFRDTSSAEILYGDTYSFFGQALGETGEYQQVYVDVNGCDSVYALNLNVVYLSFPNVVTPNGDGYNDIFAVKGLIESTIFDTPRLFIYDRWGRLIYKCENIKSMADFWDPNKTDTPDGTYYYLFFTSTRNRQVSHKSVLEVIR